MPARDIISTHPDVRGSVSEALVRCIDECYACAQACTACADACLAVDMVQQLKQCIRLNLDCADVCAATGALASRRTGFNEPILRQMLQVCAARLPGVRRGVPAPRWAARALPNLRGLPSVRAGLPGGDAGRRLGCSCASIDAKRLGATSDLEAIAFACPPHGVDLPQRHALG